MPSPSPSPSPSFASYDKNEAGHWNISEFALFISDLEAAGGRLKSLATAAERTQSSAGMLSVTNLRIITQ